MKKIYIKTLDARELWFLKQNNNIIPWHLKFWYKSSSFLEFLKNALKLSYSEYVIIYHGFEFVQFWWNFLGTSDFTEESRKDETCLQFKMKQHYIKTWKISREVFCMHATLPKAQWISPLNTEYNNAKFLQISQVEEETCRLQVYIFVYTCIVNILYFLYVRIIVKQYS